MSSIISKCYLLDRDGNVVDHSCLTRAGTVALYFSADFCKPCHEFLPLLKDFYEEVNEDEKKVEIVYVSLDKTQDAQEKYHKQMGPWPRIAYANEAEREQLKAKYGVEKIPSIIVLDTDKESAKCSDGVNDVRNMGPMAFDMKWGN
jgi:thiol-disulfide isomerase/thioredoxin